MDVSPNGWITRRLFLHTRRDFLGDLHEASKSRHQLFNMLLYKSRRKRLKELKLLTARRRATVRLVVLNGPAVGRRGRDQVLQSRQNGAVGGFLAGRLGLHHSLSKHERLTKETECEHTTSAPKFWSMRVSQRKGVVSNRSDNGRGPRSAGQAVSHLRYLSEFG